MQGLRAVAVALVVVYHFWPQSLAGGFVGVDVFFVISGFLITSHLLKKPPRSGRDLAEFWARRIRRLLPAAFVVLAVTAVVARLVAPPTQWEATAAEIIASALYVQNWVLANSAVDYLAAENLPSPTQHFWSLSVEEQFYIFWPLVAMAVAWFAAKKGWKAATSAGWTMAAVAAVSLAVSVALTRAEPAMAYFVTPTRVWELALGGLVAVLAPWTARRLTGAAAAAVAWTGLAAVLLAGFTFTAATAFPGYAALLPAGGTALVILAAAGGRAAPVRVLGTKPMQWLGEVSYSLYLWHWPLLVLMPYVSGGELGWIDKSCLVALALVLAGLSKKYVEDRFRFKRSSLGLRRTYRFAAVGMVVLAAVGSLQIAEASYRSRDAARNLSALMSSEDSCLGAAALANGECAADRGLQMDPELAKKDKPAAYKDNCWNSPPFDTRRTCTYGEGPTQVALVGNSHAGHWLPALESLAETNGWTITTYLASACTYTDAAVVFDTEQKTRGCRELGQWAQESTQGDKYDLVITTELTIPVKGANSDAEQFDLAVRGYGSYLARWEESGTNLLVLRDTPYPKPFIQSIPDCVAENADDPAQCSGSREEWLKPDPLVKAAEDLHSTRVKVADLTRYICRDDACYGVNGGLVTYFDGSHMTTAYARTMAPYLRQHVVQALAHR
ncbi:acyltransferase family protein [Arthrobacter sp. GCM10027362]|uniref:acyltransferase family protein n=1 Tax=Arthrobacter sp. GCM10027362 TaxID=3273379 RepID=UPI00362995BB